MQGFDIFVPQAWLGVDIPMSDKICRCAPKHVTLPQSLVVDEKAHVAVTMQSKQPPGDLMSGAVPPFRRAGPWGPWHAMASSLLHSEAMAHFDSTICRLTYIFCIFFA